MAMSVTQQGSEAARRRGIVIILLVLVSVAGIGGAYWYVDSGRVALDKLTYCPQDGAHSLTVVLLDRTDPLTPVQPAALRGRLEEVTQAVPRHGALQLCSVGPLREAPPPPVVGVATPARRPPTTPGT